MINAAFAVALQVLRNVRVEKKPGRQSGPVMATVNGKPQRILFEAMQVWAVMGGKNAVVLIPPVYRGRTISKLVRFTRLPTVHPSRWSCVPVGWLLIRG